jgi:hypothetical protein
MGSLLELALTASPATPATAEGLLDHAERALEARRQRVADQLRTNPDKRVCFEVADAPLNGSPGEPVSVVLAVRHGDQILTGELHIPRERWDMKAFLTTIDPVTSDQGAPS